MSAWSLCALALVLSCGRVRADGAMDAWAQWALAPKVWKGQTVLAPEPAPRPSGPFARLDSERSPVHVQAPPLRRSQLQALSALAALEESYERLRARGWPLPPPDGGFGGTLGFDLYLVDAPCGACSAPDGPLTLSDFDAAQTYALVDARLPPSAMRACVQSALVQAGLRSVDPAESESWIRASGELAAWLFNDELGCAGSLAEAQRTPELGMLDREPGSAAAGALWLAFLTERTDGGSGDFLRGLWETTRQRSRGMVDPDRLRSSPDLWEALTQTLAAARVDIHDELAEFAVARWFAGPAGRRAQSGYRVFSALPSDAGVPLSADLKLADLPRHVHSERALANLGSAYVRVNTAAASSPQLQVWLRGELGPQWSLSAVRLAADGRELGRTHAPARRVPNSYLPVSLDPETAEVLLVVTNLPDKLPDADVPAPTPHNFELILSL